MPRKAIAVAALATALATSACGGGRARRGVVTSRSSTTPTSTTSTSVSRQPAQASPAQRLTVRQLAGQRVIYAYDGLRPPASLLAAIRAGEVGGVIFFGPNIASRSQIRSVIGRLQRANAAGPVPAPLLMMTDQEGGQVRRLPRAPVLSERQIGEQSDAVASARAAGADAGHNLAGVGINVNLAPVLDVYRQPGDFIDEFQRSYSRNPGLVGSLGRAFIAAQQRTGVAATAKHFPGLGAADSDQNTDERSVILTQSRNALRTIDEAPYRNAIAAGVDLVMASWAVYPALDRERPAGLSSAWLQGELRHRLGFRGVTITDSIDAGALQPFGDLAQRGVLAARAGADLILCTSGDPAQCRGVAGAIASAIKRHQIGLAAARASVARILALRERG